jgi:hypothetical protein
MSDPRFCIIPARALEIDALKGMDLKVLCYFGKHADRHGWWRLSQVKMARSLGKARSTIQASIRRLVDAELLEIHAVDTDSGRDSAHFYRVVYDHGAPEEEENVPAEVAKTRALRAREGVADAGPDHENTAVDPVAEVPKGGADISAGGAGIPAGGADPGPAGGADSGPAPSITTHSNDPLSRNAPARRAGGEREFEKLQLSADMKRALHVGWTAWDERLSGSINQIEIEAGKLGNEQEFARATDPDRIKAYKVWLKSAGRDYLGVYSSYIRERKFDCEPVNRAMERIETRKAEEKKREEHLRSTKRLAPWGKAWMALRLERLAQGAPVDDIDNMRLLPGEIPPHEHFVQVRGDGECWRRWREWHAAMGYDLPKGDFPAWVWVPAEQPPDYPAMTWEIPPRSAEFVRGWFRECEGLKARFLRKQYDLALDRCQPIKPRVPVFHEAETVTIASGSEQWAQLQAGLVALDRAELDGEPGHDWQVPADIWRECLEASTGDPGPGGKGQVGSGQDWEAFGS